MSAKSAAELEAARQLLEERNLNLVKEEQRRLDESRNERASAAARNDQDGLKPPTNSPPGLARSGPDFEVTFRRHLDRLQREDASTIEKAHQRLHQDLRRLDEFVRKNDTDGLTRHQVAREGLAPLPDQSPHATRKTPSKEFELNASQRPGLDEPRIHIEGKAALDDLRSREHVNPSPSDVVPRAHGERQRTAEEESARQRKREELRRNEEDQRKHLQEKFNELGKDGR